MSADPKVPPVVGIQRVLHGRRARQRAVRLRAAAARGGSRRIAQVGGLLLDLRQEGRRIGLYAKLDAYGLQDAGLDTYDANLALSYSEDGRDYTVAAQMLSALGARPGSPAEQQPGQGSPAGPAHRRGAGADCGAPQRDQRSLPGHEDRQRRTRWTSRAMTCSTPRRAQTARRLLSCHLGRTSRSWWCTVTDRQPAAASARRRLAYDGAWARSSGRCSHAAASHPVNHAAARAA